MTTSSTPPELIQLVFTREEWDAFEPLVLLGLAQVNVIIRPGGLTELLHPLIATTLIHKHFLVPAAARESMTEKLYKLSEVINA